MKTFTKKEILEELIERLREVSDGADPVLLNCPGTVDEENAHKRGICNLLAGWGIYVPHYFGFLDFCKWHRFSGNTLYPVPCGAYTTAMNHIQAASTAFYNMDKWSTTTEYGNDRRDLCAFIADELEELIKEFL